MKGERLDANIAAVFARNLPRMSRAQVIARAAAKEQCVLDFLASGEVWSTSVILAALLGLHQRRANDLGQRLERDGLVTIHRVDARTTVVGITAQGLAYSHHPNAAETQRFEPGRISPQFIAHHVDTQRARLQAEAAGWTWEAGKTLFRRGWNKVPDAVAIAPSGERVAVEIERTIKTELRYAQVIPATLRDIKIGRYDRVLYLSPQNRADAIERALRRVEKVKVGGESVALTLAHWSRFKFANLDDWPATGEDGRWAEAES